MMHCDCLSEAESFEYTFLRINPILMQFFSYCPNNGTVVGPGFPELLGNQSQIAEGLANQLFAKFSRKLHENEINRVGGEGVASPASAKIRQQVHNNLLIRVVISQILKY